MVEYIEETTCMKDLKAILSLVKGSGILRFTVRMFVGKAIIMGAGDSGTGCLEVLILGWGPTCLGCSSSLLTSSSLVSVSYSLLLGATILDGIMNTCWARLFLGWAYSMIVGLSLLLK